MKIQYMSELYLEFSDNSRWMKHNELPVTGDVLLLAGDIFYLKNKVAPLSNFWKRASDNYRQVLIVPESHEYYNYCDVMDKGLRVSSSYHQHYPSFCFYKHIGIAADNGIYLIWSNRLPILANMQPLTVNHFRNLLRPHPSILTCKTVEYGFFNFHISKVTCLSLNSAKSDWKKWDPTHDGSFIKKTFNERKGILEDLSRFANEMRGTHCRKRKKWNSRYSW